MSQEKYRMNDLLGLDSLIANTAYLKAQRVDRDELRRQRLSLSLPKPKESSALCLAVEGEYESLCELQPIGKKLFQQFLLASNSQYVAAAEFLEELNRWDFAEDETKVKAKQSIIAKFSQSESRCFLSFLSGEAAEKCRELSDKNFNKVTLGLIKEATRDFLRGKPFSEYLNAPRHRPLKYKFCPHL